MPPTEPPAPPSLTAIGIPGLPEVTAGDDLAALLLAALHRTGLSLQPDDILVVSSKVISKAAGRVLAADSRQAAVADQTVRVVAERVTPRGLTQIVASRSGPVLAAAGVDASNVAPGTVLLLPEQPDASAAELRRRLAELAGMPVGRLGVLVSDTAGRPWREGQTDIAIGSSGIRVVDDLRGGTDPLGNPLEVTVRALADELAALADLVKGKLDGIPAALVRGLPALLSEQGAGAATLLRGRAADWFRFGHVEAARAAIGVEPGRSAVQPGGPAIEPVQPAVEPVRMPPGSPAGRLRSAVQVALAGSHPVTAPTDPPTLVWLTIDPPDDGTQPAAQLRVRLRQGEPGDLPPDDPDGWTAIGALAQRIVVAAWAEDITVLIRVEPGPAPTLLVTLAPPASG